MSSDLGWDDYKLLADKKFNYLQICCPVARRASANFGWANKLYFTCPEMCIQYMSCSMTKPAKWPVHPAKTRISLCICPVWQSLLSAWRKVGSLATHKAHSEDSIRLGGCPGWSESSLGARVILLVLLYCGSYRENGEYIKVLMNYYLLGK